MTRRYRSCDRKRAVVVWCEPVIAQRLEKMDATEQEPPRMISFAIAEVDDGLTIVQVPPGQGAEDAAIKEGGVLVDPGPYETYEQANDALEALEREDDQRPPQ